MHQRNATPHLSLLRTRLDVVLHLRAWLPDYISVDWLQSCNGHPRTYNIKVIKITISYVFSITKIPKESAVHLMGMVPWEGLSRHILGSIEFRTHYVYTYDIHVRRVPAL